MSSDPSEPSAAYDSRDIRVLRSPEHIRQNPGMYVGNTGPRGLLHMVTALMANSLAETAEGYGRSVWVTIHPDGSVEIADDGRGPPADPVHGHPFLDVEFLLSAGSTEPGRRWWEYAAANALSAWFRVETHHGRRVYRQEFERGEAISPPTTTGESGSRGLTVVFQPDSSIFGDTQLPVADIRDRLQVYAHLHSGVRITLSDRITGAEEHFEYEDGIRTYVERLDTDRRPLHPDVIVCRGEAEGVRYEVGLRWTEEGLDAELVYVNSEFMTYGGTPVTGLRAAVTRALNVFIRDNLPGVRHLKGREAREGLTAVVSVRLADPLFESSTRSNLANPEARRAVEAGVGAFLRDYFRQHPAVAERVVRAALARPMGPSMTAEEWQACTEPRKMLRLVNGSGSQRQAVLLVAAHFRIAVRDRKAPSLNFVRALEWYADEPLRGAFRGMGVRNRRVQGLIAAVTAPDFSPVDAGRIADDWSDADDDERAGWVREIFGNPLRPVSVDPAWLTSTVVELARGIYDEQAFDRLPILADALMDAGCDNADVLGHCRGEGPHFRGCWVIDRLLGTEPAGPPPAT